MNNIEQSFAIIDIYISNLYLLNEQWRKETLDNLKEEIEYLKNLYFKI